MNRSFFLQQVRRYLSFYRAGIFRKIRLYFKRRIVSDLCSSHFVGMATLSGELLKESQTLFYYGKAGILIVQQTQVITWVSDDMAFKINIDDDSISVFCHEDKTS